MRNQGIVWAGLVGILLVSVATATAAMAAQPTPQDYQDAVTLRERWQYLTRDIAFPAQWVPDTHDFVYRITVAGGFAFVRENADSGEKRPAFDQQSVAVALSAARHQPYTVLRLPFETFQYTEADDAIQFHLDEETWRCPTRGVQPCAQVPRTSQPRGFGVVRDLRYPADNTPKPSPDGRLEALVENHNIVVRPRGGGATTALSHDGSKDDFYDPESIRWSPDARRLVAYRVTPGYARMVTRVLSSPTDQVQPEVRQQLYPKPGDRVDQDRPVLFDVATGQAIAIDNALFPNPYKLLDLHWRADGGSFAFEYAQRGFQHARIIAVDAGTGAARAVVKEDSDTFIKMSFGGSYWHDVHNQGDEVIWQSNRDGWDHLYLYDGRTGQVKQRITTGAWPVREVLRVDDEQRQIWFAASGVNLGEDPYFVHVYRINFDGTGLTPLTSAKANHDVSFSSDMRYYVDTYSRVDLPNVAELRRSTDGSLVRTIAKGDISRLLAAGFKPPQPFVAKGRDGETDIWGLIVKPLDFDPQRKYRVIENIYAGPHDSFVPKTFWPFGYHSGGDKVIGMQAQADLGFIVVQMDGMGTANRSRAFHDVAWKNLADAGFPDRIRWHQAAAREFPWYDIGGGVGIYGASAGGQNALGALLFHPEFYSVAVAYAGCYDNRMDKISWNEQWMGWPVDDSYARSSDVVNAARLQGRLLLIVGEQDSNVDPASTAQVVNALVEAGKDFELLQIPGGEHTVGRSTGPIDYVARRQFGFFVDNLLNLPTPDWNRHGGVAGQH